MFKRNYIVFITIGCGIAMLGLIIIQFYWINSAIEQGENELKSKISASLFDIIDEVAVFEEKRIESSNDPKKIVKSLNKKLKGIGHVDSISGDVIFNKGVDIVIQNQVINEIMNDMMNFGVPNTIDERLPKTVLDSIVKRCLNKKGIESKYHFGVFDQFNKGIYSNISNVESLLSSQYNLDLFPYDLFTQRFNIYIEIPNERKIVIQSMWLMLLLSGLFVLIIIFAFYYTIATIVKQKKISMIKNDFINNMTHELKTPISTISLACEALSDADISKSEGTRLRFVNMITDENKRLGTLVENVLQSAVIDRGDLKLKKEELDLSRIITSAVQNIKIQVSKKNGKIDIFHNAQNNLIFGDKVHITNVIYNLLDNAIKYTSGTPEISITTSDLVGGVMIKIKDNGIGIAKEQQIKIFEKLYRVPTGDRHDVKGFGLGLSYVKSIVEHHEGEISLESNLGKGSSFNIYLPTIKSEQL